MSSEEYRAALATLGLSQQGFARMVGASPRTGQKWGRGEARVLGAAAVLLRLLVLRPELVPLLKEIGGPPPRNRTK